MSSEDSSPTRWQRGSEATESSGPRWGSDVEAESAGSEGAVLVTLLDVIRSDLAGAELLLFLEGEQRSGLRELGPVYRLPVAFAASRAGLLAGPGSSRTASTSTAGSQ